MHQTLSSTKNQSVLPVTKKSQSFCFNDSNCTYGNPIKDVCINKSCTTPNAVMCSDQDCQCSNAHQLCFKSSIKNIVRTIQSRAVSFKKIQTEMNKIFEDAIDKLSLIQQELLKKYAQVFQHKAYSTIETKFLQALKIGKCQNLTGSLMFEINSHLNQRQQLNKPIIDSTKQFQRVSTLLTSNINQFGMQMEKQLQSIDLFFKSTIIKSPKDKNLLVNFLAKRVEKTELLFRASEHNFNGEMFHRLCDDVRGVMVVVKTKHGKVIGGYTPSAFTSTTRIKIVEDPKLQSFLFSVTQGHKLPLTNPDFALMNYSINSDYVLSFGHDLKITNYANMNEKSMTSLSFAYSNGNYSHNQGGWKKFTGSDTHFFGIEDWEVWRIITV